MIAITSISPTHTNADIQAKAVQSWIELGMGVVSINSPEEVAKLKPLYPLVNFVSTHRTLTETYGKPLVAISAMLDYCKDIDIEQYFCLINSDIELRCDKDFISRVKVEMETQILICNRVDYEMDQTGTQYLRGFDVFFIHKRFLDYFPQSLHAMGMTFWDYWIPYVATKKGIEVVLIKQDIAFHKSHKAQYSEDNWKKSGRFFLWENMLYQFSATNEIGRMGTFVYSYIYNSSVRKEI